MAHTCQRCGVPMDLLVIKGQGDGRVGTYCCPQCRRLVSARLGDRVLDRVVDRVIEDLAPSPPAPRGLTLTRHEGQSVAIGDTTVHVHRCSRNRVVLVIDAPLGVPILRGEAKVREPKGGAA